LIDFIKKMAVAAGEICLAEQATMNSSHLAFKGRKDLVTKTDKTVELFIIEQIRSAFPDHSIHGEETGISHLSSADQWIIDPIDGTTSFFHHHPFFCVSIAYQKNGILESGVIYAPVLDELFYAQRDQGSWLNDRPIRVSKTGELIESVCATGFACLRSDLEQNNLPNFNRIVPQLRDIRRFGSAALDMCYVACGRLDGFWEMNLNVYDIAAGTLLVTEAGGIVTDFKGGQEFPHNGIVASNPFLHSKLLANL
jgi:myo-inositol-1(or 4)-monophosphatase